VSLFDNPSTIVIVYGKIGLFLGVEETSKNSGKDFSVVNRKIFYFWCFRRNLKKYHWRVLNSL